MLNDEGDQNHYHQSSDEYTNWDGNFHNEDMVERIVHNSNMLVEMIGLLIYNQENMALEVVRNQYHIIVSKTLIRNSVATRRLIISIGITSSCSSI